MVDPPSRPLHVLHLLTRLEGGGISRYTLDLARGLRAAGHTVTIAGGPGDWQSRFEGEPWQTIVVPMTGGPVALWRRAGQIERALARERLDLVHAHHRRASLVGRRLARRRGVPLLFSLHMPMIPMGLPWRWLSDFGDHALTASPEAQQWLSDTAGMPSERITMIPHGVDPQRFPQASEADRLAARQRLGLPAHAPVAGFVGRLEAPKNPSWVLDVAEAARDQLPTLRVVMMGGGGEAHALGKRIAQRGLDACVRLLPPGEPRVVYEACDLLLVPSAVEGFALVGAEAMSVGRPVLRTRTGGWQAQISADRTGRAVAVDREAFVAAALALLADRSALRRMGETAAQHARANLTFEDQLAQTVALYARLVGDNAAGGGLVA
ncbi:MAG: glycosyltransferase family 4 protein [Phycisphaeraceae bacterium]